MEIARRGLLAGIAGLGFVPALARAAGEVDIFPVVETAQGKVRGTASGGVHMFKGVRYGADTSGKNRFRPPQPPPRWAGVRDHIAYGQVAPQMPTSRATAYTGLIHFDIQPGGMGEDCLVLNLWTPTLDPNAKKPVLLHIHGGGFYGGSGNSPGYDGEELARFGDCVVITINHRLGVFGFLNLADWGEPWRQSGVVGMMDVVAALKWMRENVAAFGGDPGRVLVFGQSGGGAKTSILMGMPSGHGLFHRAGVMSGSALRVATAQQAQATAANYLKVLGVDRSKAATLQRLPFTALLAAQVKMEAADRSRGEAPRSFSPSLDGEVIPAHPFDPTAPAISAKVPMIVSTVLEERAYRMNNFDLTEAGLRAFIARRVGEARADAVLSLYRNEDVTASPFRIQARFDTDEKFRASALTQLKRRAEQGAPTWSYYWTSPSPAYGGRYGVPHGIDVGPSLHDVRGGLNGASVESVRLADELASAWVAFAAKGDPNNPKTPAWPPYALPRRTTLVLGSQRSIAVDDPRRAFREFWETPPPRPTA
jgi:para-nitrobenzyl esterase